jgi:hypothetical protein
LSLQITGETTWDKPSEPKQITDEGSTTNDSYNRRESQEESMPEDEESLPPNWVALEDVDSGDVYYANEVSVCCFV